jgi:HEAT repeat protein
MNDECPYVRRRVATALGQLSVNGSELVTNVLISALSDSDKGVRAWAVKGLGAIASPSAVAAIATAVRDHDANVSWCAVGTLQGIGVPAVTDLIKLLDCQDSEVRYRAVKVLGKIGDQRAVRSLKTMFGDPNEEVRERARFALREIEYRVAWERSPFESGKL